MIVIELDGKPRGKGRLRYRIVRSRANPMGFASGYSPAPTRRYENEIKREAVDQMCGRPPLTGPIWLRLDVFIAIPKNWSKKKRADALAGLIAPTIKPDYDNFEKVCDALNKVVWNDDKQVCSWAGDKMYSDNPRLKISVMEIEGVRSAHE